MVSGAVIFRACRQLDAVGARVTASAVNENPDNVIYGLLRVETTTRCAVHVPEATNMPGGNRLPAA
jgi:hypothetical protein